MNTLKLSIAAALSAVSLSASAATLHVAIDLSGSNPLLADERFAYAASSYVAKQIEQLHPADTVNVQTFGDRADPANLLASTYTISRRVRPQAVANSITQFIRSLPSRKEMAQGATNLLGWLELHSDFDCAHGATILVLTDAVESSAYVNAQALAGGKAKLPDPEVTLAGCSLIFFGVGAGLPPHMVKNIRGAWQGWAEKAGATFQAVIP